MPDDLGGWLPAPFQTRGILEANGNGEFHVSKGFFTIADSGSRNLSRAGVPRMDP
jgi:hypothetical protein